MHGVVQGVGFRPFVYATAAAAGTSGTSEPSATPNWQARASQASEFLL